MLSVARHIFEDEILEIDIVCRTSYGAEHGLEGRRAITQEACPIAGHEWHFGHGLLDRGMARQRPGIAWLQSQRSEQRPTLLGRKRLGGSHHPRQRYTVRMR